jgi:N4-gp56 family major capsid protein
MAVTTSSTLSSQYQSYFSKELLSYAVQALVLDQFAKKAPLPKQNGNKSITMFRFGAPSTASISALTEGTAITSANYRSLSMTSITKSLTQYGQVIGLTDILTATGLFNAMEQSTKTTGEDAALHFDSITRNVLIGSNSAGTAVEGSPLDNGDVITERYAGGAATFAALNADTTATSKLAAADILDASTQLKINRAPMINGNYVAAISPQAVRDLFRDTDWLEAAKFSNVKALYKGEIGSLYGVRFIETTNPFINQGSATVADRYVYSTAGGTGTGTGADIYVSLFFGGEAYGVPMLTGDSPMSPKVLITDSADKADPLNQTTTVGFKSYWAALRLNTGYYTVVRSKSAYVG